MLGYSSINQTLQGLVVKEKIRNYLIRFSLVNNQVFNYFAADFSDKKEKGSLATLFLDFLFESFLSELKNGGDPSYSEEENKFYSDGKPLDHRYAIAAIFIDEPAFNFQSIGPAEAYEKGLEALRKQFEQSYADVATAYSKAGLTNIKPKITIPEELWELGYSNDDVATLLGNLVSEKYFRMAPTTWPSSYPLYSAVGPLWNLDATNKPIPRPESFHDKKPDPQYYPDFGPDAPWVPFINQAARYLWAGPLQNDKNKEIASDIKLKKVGNYSLFRPIEKFAPDPATGPPTLFYLEVFFRLKKEAIKKIKLTLSGPLKKGDYFYGPSFGGPWPSQYDDKIPNVGWLQIAHTMGKQQYNDDKVVNAWSSPPSPGPPAAFGFPYWGHAGFLNDIKLASQYLSYDEVHQLIELSKGPVTTMPFGASTAGLPTGQISAEAKEASFITFDDFDMGVRLLYNASKDFVQPTDAIADLPYMQTGIKLGFLPASGIADGAASDIGAAMKAAHLSAQWNATKKFEGAFEKGTHLPQGAQVYKLIATQATKWPSAYAPLALNKIIYEHVNPFIQKVLSSKCFLQTEWAPDPGSIMSSPAGTLATAAPWGPTGKSDRAVLFSLPIAEFTSADFTDLLPKVKGNDIATGINDVFKNGIPAFLNDPNGTMDNFEDKMLSSLLFGLSQTENLKFFIDQQLSLPKIMNLFPIYSALKDSDINLAKFFLIGDSPLKNHNKMIDGILDRLVNFNEK